MQNDFNVNPIKTIQSFIGSDANIIDYKVNNLYIDGYYIVDVSYTTLDIDMMKIYWVKFKDCKLLNIKKSNAYICQINGFNVCVIINNKPENEDTWLAMNVKPTIPTQRGQTFYKYYSVVIDTPYHEATTQLFNYTHKTPNVDLNKCNVNVVLFPD